MQYLGLRRIIMGAASVAFAMALVAACGSDVTTEASTSSSTASGSGGSGSGGATATVVTAVSSSNSASAVSSSTGMVDCSMGGTCEQGCCKLEEQCGSPVGCSTLFGIAMTSCNDPAGDCAGQCLLDHSCEDILTTITTQDFGTPVAQCIVGCVGGGQGGGGGMGAQSCLGCGSQNCTGEVVACSQNASDPCNQFLTCAQACMGDNSCLDACATMHDSTLTKNIVACACKNCAAECGVACT